MGKRGICAGSKNGRMENGKGIAGNNFQVEKADYRKQQYKKWTYEIPTTGRTPLPFEQASSTDDHLGILPIVPIAIGIGMTIKKQPLRT